MREIPSSLTRLDTQQLRWGKKPADTIVVRAKMAGGLAQRLRARNVHKMIVFGMMCAKEVFRLGEELFCKHIDPRVGRDLLLLLKIV
jgi:hypothetical protein